MLMELLARETRLEVKEISRNQRPRADVVYITPPNRHVELQNGFLTVRTPKFKTGPQPSVDLFFASLALECEEQAIGIIFSGTGSDGARGIQAIKAAGGITFAQDDSAKYNGMPNTAIGTGCVDVIAPPAEIAKRIPDLLDSGVRKVMSEPEKVGSSSTYLDICAVIRTHCNIDFTNYRSSTILRRISRRMSLLHLPDLEAYLRQLTNDPSEVERLVRELLIGVTSFFRDPLVWESLQESIEKLMRAKEGRESIRVWVPGCASGEEAYTVAILFAEATRKLKKRVKVQIFASDLDGDALAIARRGIYTAAIAEQIKPTVLRRYFTPMASEFSVKHEIRDMIVFSRHNIVQDPPFSKLDLISCRNLFIYFVPDLQRRILERFHYALNRGCTLLLGKSETIGDLGDLFELVDRRCKIFRASSKVDSPFRPSPFTPLKGPVVRQSREAAKRPRSREARANEAIAKRFGPPTVIVDSSDRPVHIAGDIKPYLQVPTGASQFDVFSLVDEELRAELRALLLRSRREHVVVRSRAHTAEFHGDKWQYRIVVHPYRDDETEEDLDLIAFMTVRALLEEQEDDEKVEETGRGGQVKELEHELLAMREHLHTMVSELETSNEELQSLNEELQSSNEELQSTNEELETSNEELQSTNEELTTVNEEIVVKSDALNEANSFQASILESISNAVIVTDNSLRIQRFNVAATKIFKIDDSSIGEPLVAVKARYRMPDLRPIVQEVIVTGEPRSKPVRSPRNDRYYELQVHPCLDAHQHIIGAVLTLNDVSRLARANVKLRRSRSELAEEVALRSGILDSTPAQIAVLDRNGVIISVNEAWREFGRDNDAKDQGFSVGRNYLAICGEGDHEPPDEGGEVTAKLKDVLSGRIKSAEVRYTCHSPTEERWFKCVMRSGLPHNEQLGALVMHFDITSEVLLEESMAAARRLAEEASRAKSSFLANMSHELRTPLNAIIGFSNMIGAETYGKHRHPKYAEYGRDIGNAADHLLRMINHILDLSKIESGHLELRESLVDLASCHKSVFKLFEEGAKLHNVKLESRVARTLPRLHADEGAINQILINLIGNAIKFTGGEGKITCSARVERASGAMKLEVADNGIGIAQADLERITEPFAQVRSTLTSNNSGVGLGLSLVDGLAKLHQAKVDIESEVGQGTKVTLTFPRDRVKTPLPKGTKSSKLSASADAAE